MLETSKERIQLLKAGFTGKQIEELYVIYNNFKIIGGPVLCEIVKINPQKIRCKCFPVSQESSHELSLF